MIIWNSEVVEFCCSADVNVSKKVSEKENIYGPRFSKSHDPVP